MGIITELNYYPDRHFRYVEIRGGVPVSKTGKDHRNIYAGLGKHLGG